MTFIPAGPPDDPEAMLTGTLDAAGLTLQVTAIAVRYEGTSLVAHPNHSRTLNDLYNLGTPSPTYTQSGRAYIVFGITAA
jgi:hypothetical protein